MLLGNYRYDIQLLNTNGRRHTVKFTGWSELASLGVDLNQVWANLVASNLNIEFAGTYSVTQTNEANNDENTIHFEYLNLTNVTLITNDYILDANQLFIDFESYTSSLMQDNVNITDANTPIASIIFYDDYIELVSSDEVIKRIYLSENMSFTFETNRPTSSTLKIVDGEGGNIHLPYGVTITIISYNEDGFDFLIDDSLKELIYVLAKPLNKLLKKYLTPIEIAAIVIGCVAGVGLTIILLCIRWHKLKNIAREKIVEMSMPELDGLQQEEKITGVKKNDKEVYVNFE
ncbi:hypothetical protein GPJ56_008727 [Histomonas meleagridis]|uniref:uncharacterized protein n=1 Tax=Histomonas meleagridis TaxID=135588 RepID=UPI003559C255|nr:hypothetical protein GPJ56_008727 [Histomonas meleagridis]KAH0803304.1 hypothetical protein GO595_004040 [Histomonas meleagridis]